MRLGRLCTATALTVCIFFLGRQDALAQGDSGIVGVNAMGWLLTALTFLGAIVISRWLYRTLLERDIDPTTAKLAFLVIWLLPGIVLVLLLLNAKAEPLSMLYVLLAVLGLCLLSFLSTRRVRG